MCFVINLAGPLGRLRLGSKSEFAFFCLCLLTIISGFIKDKINLKACLFVPLFRLKMLIY